MKKLYAIIISLILALPSFAQWPANYDGVMLQAFYWNSYEDTQWTELKAQAPELSKYFNLLWIPNSAYCTDGQSMGYDPVYWLRHNCSFGSLRDLKQLISTYKELGVGMIGDVILNHRKGLYDWCDFPEETWTHDGITETMTWSLADICQNDDGGYTREQGYNVTGANDTGDDFSGFRDLDHTGENVQKNCKLYLRYLRQNLGYSGFRLDMVKGYKPEYTKLYNEEAKPEFCVGEYWDGDASKLINWINGTGKTSAVFDFALKYVIRDAFGGGNWSALSNKGLAGSPDYSRYSVTFVDNHDTYENQDRLTGNVLAANGLILALPGTPCIFLKHWQRYPIAIGNMILARKACGVTNQSSITEGKPLDGGYVIKTQGSKGTVLYICGFPQYDTTGFKCIASGTNFAYFVSDNITVEGLTPGSDEEDEQPSVTVYVEAAAAPYLYAWTGTDTKQLGEWPGMKMTETAEVTSIDGTTTKKFWKHTFSVAPVNVIFSNGSVQTADINGLTHDSYFTFDSSNSDKETNFTNITTHFYTAPAVTLPACVTPIEGHIYCYFKGNKDYDTPYAWAWNDNGDLCKNTWPGDAMKRVGYDDGKAVWLWDLGEATGSNMPTGVLFSNKGSEALKTSDFQFVNGGYYDVYGLLGNATTGIGAVLNDSGEMINDKVLYDLQGRRVSDSYRGVVIKNGRKVIRR